MMRLNDDNVKHVEGVYGAALKITFKNLFITFPEPDLFVDVDQEKVASTLFREKHSLARVAVRCDLRYSEDVGIEKSQATPCQPDFGNASCLLTVFAREGCVMFF